MWAKGPRFIPIFCFHMERRFFLLVIGGENVK